MVVTTTVATTTPIVATSPPHRLHRRLPSPTPLPLLPPHYHHDGRYQYIAVPIQWCAPRGWRTPREDDESTSRERRSWRTRTTSDRMEAERKRKKKGEEKRRRASWRRVALFSPASLQLPGYLSGKLSSPRRPRRRWRIARSRLFSLALSPFARPPLTLDHRSGSREFPIGRVTENRRGSEIFVFSPFVYSVLFSPVFR